MDYACIISVSAYYVAIFDLLEWYMYLLHVAGNLFKVSKFQLVAIRRMRLCSDSTLFHKSSKT